jgi:hypothetical protein
MLTEAGPRGMVMTATGPTSSPPPLGTGGAGSPPVIGAFTASRTAGPAPLTTAFSWTVSDPDGSALTCRLDFDVDGTWDVTVPSCTSQSMRSATFGSAGTHTVALQVTDMSGASTTATVALVAGAASTDPFNITLRFGSGLTSSQQAAFSTAAARWSRVIRGGLADTPVTVAANDCGTGAPAYSGTIDDLMIDVSVAPIDGASGVLAQAGPCLVRTADGLPVYGVMQLDASDVAGLESSGLLSSVVLHEMGHVLGFGTLWTAPTLSDAGTLTVSFGGPVALGAWRTLSSATGGVPVENSGGVGTADSHWRESVFGTELMTGYIDVGSNPLSAVTIGSLADLGYTVDLRAADAFGLGGVRAATATAPVHVATRLVHPHASV